MITNSISLLFLAIVGASADYAFRGAAFISNDMEGCQATPEKKILEGWAQDRIESLFKSVPDIALSSRRLEDHNRICDPCIVGLMPCLICDQLGCSCPHDSSDGDGLLWLTSEVDEPINEYATKHEMSEYVNELENWPGDSACDLAELWFVVYES